MKKVIALLIFALTVSSNIFSQNVGIGTTTPSNTLHVVPVTPGSDPLRVEGLQIFTNETSVFAVNPTTGVVKHMPINSILANVDSLYLDSTILSTVINNFDTIFGLMRDSLLLDSTFINTLRDSVDTDIDSMIFANDTLYLYEDNQMLTAYINASTDTNLVDSLILANSDTLYSIISDSLLKDTLWIKNLDSLLSIYGDTIYFNDSTYVLVRDSLLGDTLFIDSLYTIISDSLLSDSLWLDSLGKLINDNDWNVNSNGTGLEAAPAGNNVASGQYAIAAGYLDSATAQYSTISGGGYNKAMGISSTVGGGADNYALGNSSTIAGGQDNVAINAYSSIGGGFNDTTDGDYATVAGGIENRASAYGAFIGGGQTNKATNDYSVIGGGYLNNATGTYTFIGGGLSDTATGSYSVISGGNQNKATGSYSSITGGYQNLAQGSYSTVGGYRDTATGSYGAVLAGRENKISGGSYSTITGGYQSKMNNSSYSSVHGYRNIMDNASYSTINGRQDTIIRSLDGTFISGYQNSAIASLAGGAWTGRNVILGYQNKIYVASGTDSHTWSILGGGTNKIFGQAGSGWGITIAGGWGNTIETPSTGQWNAGVGIISSLNSKVLAHPTAGSGRSIILGGENDTLQGSGGTTMSGAANKAYGGGWHVLLGGNRNIINNQWFSSIIGGWRNLVSNSHSSSLIAGQDNIIQNANKSVILGGDTNAILKPTGTSSFDGLNALILGGRGNTANNFAQVTLGHYSTNSVPVGSDYTSITPDNIILKVGNGTDASNLNDAMVVKANGNVGINTSNPTNQLHIAGGADPLRLEGLQTGGSTDSVLVTDGTGVVKKTSLNSITRVCGDHTFTNLEGETVVSHGLFCIANNRTFTLPAANLVTGRKYVVKLETTPTTATISATSGNIDGGANYEMVGAGVSSVILQSDGANYWIIGSH